MGCLNNEYPPLRVIRVEGERQKSEANGPRAVRGPQEQSGPVRRGRGRLSGDRGQGRGQQGARGRKSGRMGSLTSPLGPQCPTFLQNLPPRLTRSHPVIIPGRGSWETVTTGWWIHNREAPPPPMQIDSAPIVRGSLLPRGECMGA